MKKIFLPVLSFTLLTGATLWSGCSSDTIMEEIQLPVETEIESEDTCVATLIAGLPGNNTESRLAFELATNGKSIKTYWESGDQLVANATPRNEEYAFIFDLTAGEGTTSGTFTCTKYINGCLPQNITSNAWTMYFPGSKIQSEQDYLDVSYLGQKQIGDNNLDHIKDYHSLRLNIAGSISFDNSFIDFSSNNVKESACMRFKLNNLESSTPSKIELMYINPEGNYESCFHTYNYLDTIWSGASKHVNTTSRMELELAEFSATTSLTAYMMLSNYDINIEAGGKFRVLVTTDKGKFYCDKAIKSNAVLKGGKLHSITCSEWTAWKEDIDGFDNPESGVVVLQEAKFGNPGADIIIMGDGFAEDQFTNGNYATYMNYAYEDFFSVEPYTSLQDYFNVYYINAVSPENHDATPQTNGAIMGDAVTIFDTEFTSGSTSISGNDAMVLQYAEQAIRTKGGKGGKVVTDETEVSTRAYTALIMVMVNVPCHAGTCWGYHVSGTDYAPSYAIAYTSLGNSDFGRKWTTIHEAGGHGFGKLADEYEQYVYTTFSTSEWDNLDKQHSWGYNRNADKYWGSEELERWSGLGLGEESYTDTTNVYWSALLSNEYEYKKTIDNAGKGEGLKFYRGGKTFGELYCRPTENSVMRNQFGDNGQFFNAISRWAIWYRLMRLTNTISTDFENSLSEFISFDNTLSIPKNISTTSRSVLDMNDGLKPLAPPVFVPGHWENGRIVKD